MILDLKKNNEVFLTVELPEKLDDISLSQAIMFRNRYDEYINWVKSDESQLTGAEYSLKQISLMAMAVAGFLDVEADKLSDIRVGDNDDVGSLVDSLHGLLGHIVGRYS